MLQLLMKRAAAVGHPLETA